MNYLFRNCLSIRKLENFDKWKIKKNPNTNGMFEGCKGITLLVPFKYRY